jgi:hypothetical protein
MLKEKTDSISKSANGQAKIIIAGDFNCTPGDKEILSLCSSDNDSAEISPLFNLAELPASKGVGTYRYMGAWEMIDQVIVSEWLLKSTTGIYSEQVFFRVFNPEFLLRRNPAYPGLIPFSTFRGYRYQGGFSDHLPVILDLKNR